MHTGRSPRSSPHWFHQPTGRNNQNNDWKIGRKRERGASRWPQQHQQRAMTTKLCVTTNGWLQKVVQPNHPYPTGNRGWMPSQKITHSRQCGRRSVGSTGHVQLRGRWLHVFYKNGAPEEFAFVGWNGHLAFGPWIAGSWGASTMGPDRGEKIHDAQYTYRYLIHHPVRWGPIVMLQGCSAVPTEGQQKEANRAGRDLLWSPATRTPGSSELADEAAVGTPSTRRHRPKRDWVACTVPTRTPHLASTPRPVTVHVPSLPRCTVFRWRWLTPCSQRKRSDPSWRISWRMSPFSPGRRGAQ